MKQTIGIHIPKSDIIYQENIHPISILEKTKMSQQSLTIMHAHNKGFVKYLYFISEQ